MPWSPGERADAHQVVGVLREKFARPEKRASREFVAQYFAASGARKVVDLWGGGASAETLRSFLPDATIISAENGSVCKTDWLTDRLGRSISQPRLKRAHEIAASEGGYEALWGDVSKSLPLLPDAIWLDFCAQWHPGLAKLLQQLRHLRHLALTIMPERDGLGMIGLEARLLSLTTIVSAYADMVPAYVGSYQRNELGQDMALIILEARRSSGDGREVVAIYPGNILKGIGQRGFWSSRRVAALRTPVLVKCSKCGGSFTYRPAQHQLGTTRRKLCDDCRHQSWLWRNPPRERECKRCGKSYTIRRGTGAGWSYCSKVCSAKPHKPRPARRDAICHPGLPSYGTLFGGTLCHTCYDRRRKRVRKTGSDELLTVECARCGQPFTRVRFGPRKFCSAQCRTFAKPRQPAKVKPTRLCVCGEPLGKWKRSCEQCAPTVTILPCVLCGGSFVKRSYNKGATHNRFCSRSCSMKWYHRNRQAISLQAA